jgi:cold shock protein
MGALTGLVQFFDATCNRRSEHLYPAGDGIPSDECALLCSRLALRALGRNRKTFRLIVSFLAAQAIARAQPDALGKIMTIGTVKFFNTSKGFGFIAPEGGGKDVFVHATAVEMAGMRGLDEGQRVSFDIEPDAKGSKAVNLQMA